MIGAHRTGDVETAPGPTLEIENGRGRTVPGMIGNGIATIVVAKWENSLDERKLLSVLSGTDAEYADDPEEMLILEESTEAVPATVAVKR